MTNGKARAVPADPHAEACLLGAAMLDSAAHALVAALAPDVWYTPAHGHIATALRALHDRGEPADPTTVHHELQRAGLADAAGGHSTLVEVMAYTPTASSAPTYARIVVDLATKRQLLAAAGEIAAIAGNGHTGPEAVEAARRLVEQLATVPEVAGTAPLRLTPASTVRVDRPAWAWAERIPLAGVTLIPGREGEGKTALVGHIAARLTRGDLPGDRLGRPGDVVYIGHEDDRSTVLVPRLIAAGADLDRFLFVDLAKDRPFALSVDTADLARQCTDRDIAAVVLDPLDAHLGSGVDSHKKADVQAAIARLAGLTQLLRCAGIGIAHLNKGDARDVLLKVVGSVGLTTAVRSVLAVGAHPHRPDEKVAVVRKANMTNATAVPAVRFRVEGTTIDHPDDGDSITTARVVLLGEETGIAADDILTTNDNDRAAKVDHAAEWLADTLTAGPLPKADVVTLARAEGIAPRTLERAAEQLSVVTERDDNARGRPACWRLPDA